MEAPSSAETESNAKRAPGGGGEEKEACERRVRSLGSRADTAWVQGDGVWSRASGWQELERVRVCVGAGGGQRTNEE